jgi:hypothetical protein
MSVLNRVEKLQVQINIINNVEGSVGVNNGNPFVQSAKNVHVGFFSFFFLLIRYRWYS